MPGIGQGEDGTLPRASGLKHPIATFSKNFWRSGLSCARLYTACVHPRPGARGGTAGGGCQDWFWLFTPIKLRPSSRERRGVEQKAVSVMLKIRVQGLPEEVEEFAAELENLRYWEVSEESGDYANRGGSKLVRRYIEVAKVEE